MKALIFDPKEKHEIISYFEILYIILQVHHDQQNKEDETNDLSVS